MAGNRHSERSCQAAEPKNLRALPEILRFRHVVPSLKMTMLCAWLWLGVSPSFAQSNQEKLTEIQQQQSQAEEISGELKSELQSLAREQHRLKKDLVRLAKELRSTEDVLAETAAKQTRTKADVAAAIESLRTRRGELGAMIQAAVRLSQVPPQAMIMMPEMSTETMQTARSMNIMAETLRRRAAELRQQIEALNALRAELKTLKEKSEKQLAGVKKKQQAVAVKLEARQSLNDKLNKQLGLEKTRLASLGKKAKNLQQLMSAVDKEKQRKTAELGAAEKKAAAYVDSAIRSGGSKGKMRPFRSAKGKLNAPAAGKIIGRYNAKSAKELSKGMTIETLGGASVGAPFDGKVAYAGDFRGYGNMVILKHSQDYFTLMAGLGRIDTSAGEVILEGEPLGAMQAGDARKLYVELRKGSEPVNPKDWFRGL